MNDNEKHTITQFWDKFDQLAGHISRYNLPEDKILEDALQEHGVDKMLALIDKICADVETGEDTIKNPSGLIVSTIRGNTKFPPIYKERKKGREEPNWYKQALLEIEQYNYYVVYDSKGTKQKDMTSQDVLLLRGGLDTLENPLIDTFWTVYGCLKMIRVPALYGSQYPAPELSICRTFNVFNELDSFFRGNVKLTEDQSKRIAEWLKKSQEGRAAFEVRQPGLVRISPDISSSVEVSPVDEDSEEHRHAEDQYVDNLVDNYG